VPEDDQDVQQTETHRRHDEEIHGGNTCRVIVKECLPGRRPPSLAPRHVLGDGRLLDFDPELQEFTMNARRAPQPVGEAHLADQVPDLQWNLWSAATRARLPAPVQAEAGPMPPDDRLWLDNGDGVQYRRKQVEPDEEQSATANFGFGGTRRCRTFN
jgi:hypothetical protein